MDYEQMPSSQNQGNYYQNQHDPNKDVMGMGEWLITLIVLAIPCVNIIMAFVWAFSSKEKKSKSNYFKAWLIFMAIVIVLYIILLVVFGAAMAASFSAISTY